MNIVKTFRLGIVTRTYREPARPYLFVTAFGFFDLHEPVDFDLDTKMWPFVAGALSQGAVLDAGMPKPHGEVLLIGEACAPAGETRQKTTVELNIGSVRKQALVLGDRWWRLGPDEQPVFTEPRPFERIPLDWQTAFGGPGFETNPVGRGDDAAARIQAGQPARLPNIEDPRAPILSIHSRPQPVGFGPVDLTWPQRMRHAGTHDEAWLKHRHPAHPEDFDWHFYSAAPGDQQIQGFFAGDERFRLVGLSPDHPVIEGRLPGLRARCFVCRRDGEGRRLDELPMRLDTVWLFGTAGKGIVTFRAGTPVADLDAGDVDDVMLAYERIGDPARPREHYVEVHRLRTDPETKGLHALNEAQLRPPIPEAELAEREAARAAYADEQHEQRQQRFERQYAAMLGRVGLPAPPAGQFPKLERLPLPVIMPGEVERMEVDLAGIWQAMERIAADVEAQAAALVQENEREVGQWLARLDRDLGALMPPATRAVLAEAVPQGTTLPEGDAKLLDLGEARAGLLELGGERGAAIAESLDGGLDALAREPPPEGVVASQIAAARARALGLPEGSPLAGARAALVHAKRPTVDELRRDVEGLTSEEAARLDGVLGAPPPPAAPPKLPSVEDFLQQIAGTAPDAESQAKLEATARQAGPALEQVNRRLLDALPGAPTRDGVVDLAALTAGIQAKNAPVADPDAALADAATVLDDAEREMAAALGEARRQSPEPMAPAEPLLPEAARALGRLVLDLRAAGESLAGRDLAGAELVGADLTGADLRGAFLERADLTAAKLSGADLTDVVLTAATLDRADLTGARMARANLAKARARQAVLAETDLTGAILMEAQLERADLSGARLDDANALKARLNGATLDGASARQTILLEASLAGASLRGARFEACLLLNADLSEVAAQGSALLRCALVGVRADGADFSDASLEGSAAIGGASFRRASFARARAAGSTWRGADLAGADLGHAILDRADLGDAKLVAASLFRASLVRTVLAGADLTDADLASANLLEALLRRAVLLRADCRSANLYAADLDAADLRLCDLTGANLAKTLLDRVSDHA